MNLRFRLGLLVLLLCLGGCISLRPALPAEAATLAAGRYIAQVWAQTPPAAGPARGRFKAASPEVERLQSQMEARYFELGPQLAAGTVGLDTQGYVVLREAQTLDPEARTLLRGLVANENSDRAALYSELAALNRHPRWQAEIRAIFAACWQAQAPAGWWLQDARGLWQQK